MLEALIDLAKIAPGLLKPQMENVAQVHTCRRLSRPCVVIDGVCAVKAMANIASSSALDTDTRKLATEFLVSYVEALPGAGMCVSDLLNGTLRKCWQQVLLVNPLL